MTTPTTTTTTPTDGAATTEAIPMPWVGAKLSKLPDGERLHLVRLSAVVRWLMGTKRIEFPLAAEDLYVALEDAKGLRLYLTNGNGAARAVGDSDSFGLDGGGSQRRIHSRGIDDVSGSSGHAVSLSSKSPLPKDVTHGQSAALHYVGKVWGNGRNPESTMDRDDLLASCLAITCEQAAALWGMGNVVHLQTADASSEVQHLEATQPKKPSQKDMHPEWTGERLKKRQTELKQIALKNGTRSKHTELLSIETGIPRRVITQRINDAGGVAGSMAHQLVKVGGKK